MPNAYSSFCSTSPKLKCTVVRLILPQSSDSLVFVFCRPCSASSCTFSFFLKLRVQRLISQSKLQSPTEQMAMPRTQNSPTKLNHLFPDVTRESAVFQGVVFTTAPHPVQSIGKQIFLGLSDLLPVPQLLRLFSSQTTPFVSALNGCIGFFSTFWHDLKYIGKAMIAWH